METKIKDFIANLPKAELHVHLEGTLEPSLVRTLAARNQVPIPSALQTRTSGYSFHDLTSFLAVYYPNMSVLLTSTDFFDLAYNYLVKAHSQCVKHVEMFFDPQAHTSRGVSFSAIITGYRQAIVKAERELGISASLIMCFLRDLDPKWAMDTLMQSLAYRDWIIGVGLDSDERNNPPEKFKEVFARARKEGYLLTMHCDIDQVNSIEHIRQAVEDIGVDRLDHGTNIVESEPLVDLVRQKGIGLTCCPVSNSVVTVDFKGKEIKELLEKGVRCTIASDDPAYFRAYMNENLEKMLDVNGLGMKDLVELERNAFTISWIAEKKRERFLGMLDDYAKKWEVV